MIYTTSNWYWVVAGSTTQVWSSARATYVPVTDATYVAWVANSGVATAIVSEAELQEVLARQYPAGWPQTLAQQAEAAMLAGIQVTSDSAPALNGLYDCGPTAQAHITTEVVALLHSSNSTFADGTGSIVWPNMTGSLHTFTTAQFTPFALAVGTYVSALYKVINGVLTTLPSNAVTIP